MTQRLFNREVRVVFTNRENPSDIITIDNPLVKGKAPIKIEFQVEKQLALGTLNRADLTITNLSYDTASKINFRKPVLDQIKLQENRFGRRVEIYAGYYRVGPNGKLISGAKKIFRGVVVSAITSKEGELKITRVECLNDYYEIMRTKVSESFSKGTLKSSAILKILNKIGATIEDRQAIQARLAGVKFEDETSFDGPAHMVLNKIQKGVLGLVNIHFGDIGARFNPVGIPNAGEKEKTYSQDTGLIGTPKPTEIGANFVTQLDNELNLGTPVLLGSRTILAFWRSGRFVVRQIIHAGTNDAEGDFQSRVTSVFNRSAIV